MKSLSVSVLVVVGHPSVPQFCEPGPRTSVQVVVYDVVPQGPAVSIVSGADRIVPVTMNASVYTMLTTIPDDVQSVPMKWYG